MSVELSLGEGAYGAGAKEVSRSPKEYFSDSEEAKSDIDDITVDTLDSHEWNEGAYDESIEREKGDGKGSINQNEVEDKLKDVFSAAELKDGGPLAEQVAQIMSTGSLYGSQMPFVVDSGVGKTIVKQLEGFGSLTVVDFHGYHCSAPGCAGEVGFGVAAARSDASILSVGIGNAGAEITEMMIAQRDMQTANHISASRASLSPDFVASLKKTMLNQGRNIFDVGIISDIQAIIVASEEALLPHELEDLIGELLPLFAILYVKDPLPDTHFFSYWKDTRELLSNAFKRASGSIDRLFATSFIAGQSPGPSYARAVRLSKDTPPSVALDKVPEEWRKHVNASLLQSIPLSVLRECELTPDTLEGIFTKMLLTPADVFKDKVDLLSQLDFERGELVLARNISKDLGANQTQQLLLW